MAITNELLFISISIALIIVLVFLFKQKNKTEQPKNDEIEDKFNNLRKSLEANFEAILNKTLVNSTDYIQNSSQKTLVNSLRPLVDEIRVCENKIEKMVKEEGVGRETLKQIIYSVSQVHQQFSEDAKSFTTSIRNSSNLLGRWGETSCENLLAGSGYTINDYVKQKEFITKSGRTVKPDFIVKLPQGRGVAIDAKCSLNNFMNYLEEADEATKEKHLTALVDNLKNHYQTLSQKNYQEIKDIECIDFTVLYLPSDQVLWLILKKSNDILRQAMSKNVLICTPVSLMGLLRIVEGLTRQHKQAENLLEIVKISSKLYEKLGFFTERLADAQEHLDKTSKSLKTAISHLSVGEKSIISESRKLKEIGIGNGKKIIFPVVDDDDESKK